MAESPAKKTTGAPRAEAKASEDQKHNTVRETPGTGTAPVAPGRFQPGEQVTAPLTTNPPRGLDELPSDALAEDAAGRDVQEQVNAVMQEEQEKGYRGYDTDPTPNRNYTLAGQAEGADTPETVVITPRRA